MITCDVNYLGQPCVKLPFQNGWTASIVYGRHTAHVAALRTGGSTMEHLESEAMPDEVAELVYQISQRPSCLNDTDRKDVSALDTVLRATI